MSAGNPAGSAPSRGGGGGSSTAGGNVSYDQQQQQQLHQQQYQPQYSTSPIHTGWQGIGSAPPLRITPVSPINSSSSPQSAPSSSAVYLPPPVSIPARSFTGPPSPKSSGTSSSYSGAEQPATSYHRPIPMSTGIPFSNTGNGHVRDAAGRASVDSERNGGSDFRYSGDDLHDSHDGLAYLRDRQDSQDSSASAGGAGGSFGGGLRTSSRNSSRSNNSIQQQQQQRNNSFGNQSSQHAIAGYNVASSPTTAGLGGGGLGLTGVPQPAAGGPSYTYRSRVEQQQQESGVTTPVGRDRSSLQPIQTITTSVNSTRASPHNHYSHLSPSKQNTNGSLTESQASQDGTTAGGTLLRSAVSMINEEHDSAALCGSCNLPVHGPYVRALKTVFHLDCFRCEDCGIVVAQKFFPVESESGDGKQYPLCETDYFKRLNMICAKCGLALRGSYVTACNKKYHVEHFTCSICPTLIGPEDSYYEHEGEVFCHFHYSTRFATKCVGCGVAILKQFVEINRNQIDECWHPECYMIQKFWNVRLSLSETYSKSPISTPAEEFKQIQHQQEEESETAETLKAKQQEMEEQVRRVWTVLSAFEESSAACISEMLGHVSNGMFMDAVNLAEKFVFHVEVLFASIDVLDQLFYTVNEKGMSHVREAKLLCRTTVNFFALLAHTQGSVQQTAITGDLLSLVTRLAHYLKILIRLALTGALKLEREFGLRDALPGFLDRLAKLSKDGGDPRVRRRRPVRQNSDPNKPAGPDLQDKNNCGYRSLLLPDGSSLLTVHTEDSNNIPLPLDICVECSKPIEDDCVRLGTFIRWHAHCVKCMTCQRPAAPKDERQPTSVSTEDGVKLMRPPPLPRSIPPLDEFFYIPRSEDAASVILIHKPKSICCISHMLQDAHSGFEATSRLEQFSFLLYAALRRLYSHLKLSGAVPQSPAIPHELSADEAQARSMYDSFRDSNDVQRMKSVNLDRKISNNAKVPKRSTVVESPSGKVAKATDPSTYEPVPPVPAELVQLQSAVSTPQSGQPTWLRSPAAGNQNTANLSSFAVVGSGSSNLYRTRPPTSTSVQSTPRPGEDSPQRNTDINVPSNLSVIRPPFARNNTSVRIVSEPSPDSDTFPKSFAPGEIDTTESDAPASAEESQGEESQYDHFVAEEVPSLTHSEIPNWRSVEPRAKLMSELSEIQTLVIKHFAVLHLQKSPIADAIELDDLLELMNKKNNFWNKLFKGGADKKKEKKKGVFGVPIEQLVERTGSDSVLGANMSANLRVPTFIEDIVAAMKQMDMSVEGVFRKNGNIRRLKEICDALDRDPATVNFADENPVQLAALLKKFLRELPDPLLTVKLHKLFCATQSLSNENDRKRYLHLVMSLLPRYNRDTVEVLFVFLKWVASFSHIDEETGSKMDLDNLSTVIAPSILYSKGGNPLRDESFIAIKAVAQLLRQQDEFYKVPIELLQYLDKGIVDLIEKNIDMPTKEMHKLVVKLNSKFTSHRQAQNPEYRFGPPGVRPEMRLASHRSDSNLSEVARAAPPISTNSSFQGMANNSSRPSSWSQHPLEGFHNAGVLGMNGSSTGSSKPFMQSHNNRASSPSNAGSPSSPRSRAGSPFRNRERANSGSGYHTPTSEYQQQPPPSSSQLSARNNQPTIVLSNTQRG